jgi:branched-chain amino acid aminotransferase
MAVKYPVKITQTTQSKLSAVDFSNLPFGKVISDHMFVADYDGEQWTDFRIEPFGLLDISPCQPCAALRSKHF